MEYGKFNESYSIALHLQLSGDIIIPIIANIVNCHAPQKEKNQFTAILQNIKFWLS